MSALTAISLLGSGFGFWLGAPLLWAGDGLHRVVRRLLGGLLITASVVVALIALEHAGLLTASWLEPLELVLTLVAAPLLYLTVRAAAGWLPRPGDVIHLLPLALFLGHTALALRFGFGLVSIRVVMTVQVAYTAAAAIVWLAASPRDGSRRLAWPSLLLAGFALIHLAQFIRITQPGAAAREAVPLAVTIVFLVIAAAGFHRSVRTAAVAVGPRPRYQRSPLRPDEVGARLAALDRVMEVERAFTDPHLSISAVAARIGVPPYQVSQLLNQHRRTSFNDWVSGYRLAEAQALLVDAASDRTTIEAVAHAAGFRSRAGFYRVFRQATGLTPSEFRDRERALADSSPPAG